MYPWGLPVSFMKFFFWWGAKLSILGLLFSSAGLSALPNYQVSGWRIFAVISYRFNVHIFIIETLVSVKNWKIVWIPNKMEMPSLRQLLHTLEYKVRLSSKLWVDLHIWSEPFHVLYNTRMLLIRWVTLKLHFSYYCAVGYNYAVFCWIILE
jgi:hypothetical protein